MSACHLPPELWDQILSSLSDTNLALQAFSLASHTCRDLAQPHIFKKLVVQGGISTTSFAVFTSFLQDHPIIASHIRDLRLDWDVYGTFKSLLPPRLDPSSLHQILSSLPSLKSLYIRDVILVASLPFDSPHKSASFSLDRLFIECSTSDQLLTNCPILGLYQILSLFLCVKDLKIIQLPPVLRCSCKITESSQAFQAQSPQQDQYFDQLFDRHPISPQLRLAVTNLRVWQHADLYPLALLLNILQRTPSSATIMSISASCAASQEASQYGELISRCGSRIELLDLTISDFYHEVRDVGDVNIGQYFYDSFQCAHLTESC